MRIRMAVAMVAMALTAAAPGNEDATFNVGGVDLAMPLPSGYCLPKGNLVALAQTVATADTANVTTLTLYQCNATVDELGEYVLLKTPVRALTLTIDRPAFLAMVAPEFEKSLAVDKDKIDKEVGDSLGRASGVEAKVTTKIDARGHDDVCAYIAGRALMAAGNVSEDVAVGGCITAVGGRVVEVFKYTKYRTDGDVDRMVKEARALALTIRPAAKP